MKNLKGKENFQSSDFFTDSIEINNEPLKGFIAPQSSKLKSKNNQNRQKNMLYEENTNSDVGEIFKNDSNKIQKTNENDNNEAINFLDNQSDIEEIKSIEDSKPEKSNRDSQRDREVVKTNYLINNNNNIKINNTNYFIKTSAEKNEEKTKGKIAIVNLRALSKKDEMKPPSSGMFKVTEIKSIKAKSKKSEDKYKKKSNLLGTKLGQPANKIVINNLKNLIENETPLVEKKEEVKNDWELSDKEEPKVENYKKIENIKKKDHKKEEKSHEIRKESNIKKAFNEKNFDEDRKDKSPPSYQNSSRKSIPSQKKLDSKKEFESKKDLIANDSFVLNESILKESKKNSILIDNKEESFQQNFELSKKIENNQTENPISIQDDAKLEEFVAHYEVSNDSVKDFEKKNESKKVEVSRVYDSFDSSLNGNKNEIDNKDQDISQRLIVEEIKSSEKTKELITNGNLFEENRNNVSHQKFNEIKKTEEDFSINSNRNKDKLGTDRSKKEVFDIKFETDNQKNTSKKNLLHEEFSFEKTSKEKEEQKQKSILLNEFDIKETDEIKTQNEDFKQVDLNDQQKEIFEVRQSDRNLTNKSKANEIINSIKITVKEENFQEIQPNNKTEIDNNEDPRQKADDENQNEIFTKISSNSNKDNESNTKNQDLANVEKVEPPKKKKKDKSKKEEGLGNKKVQDKAFVTSEPLQSLKQNEKVDSGAKNMFDDDFIPEVQEFDDEELTNIKKPEIKQSPKREEKQNIVEKQVKEEKSKEKEEKPTKSKSKMPFNEDESLLANEKPNKINEEKEKIDDNDNLINEDKSKGKTKEKSKKKLKKKDEDLRPQEIDNEKVALVDIEEKEDLNKNKKVEKKSQINLEKEDENNDEIPQSKAVPQSKVSLKEISQNNDTDDVTRMKNNKPATEIFELKSFEDAIKTEIKFNSNLRPSVESQREKRISVFRDVVSNVPIFDLTLFSEINYPPDFNVMKKDYAEIASKYSKGIDKLKADLNNFNLFALSYPISSLHPQSDYYEIFQTKVDFLNDIILFRLVLNDGNCFYRTFIFSYIEFCILHCNIDELKMIIVNLNKMKDKQFNSQAIQYSKTHLIQILLIIIELIGTKEIFNAHQTFLKAIYAYENFDKGLILYLKQIVAEFYKDNFQIFMENENFKSLIPKEYFADNNFEKEIFIESITQLNRQAEIPVFYLTAMVLKTNLKFYVVDCSIHGTDNPKYSITSLIKSQTNKINLNFAYKSYSFCVLYDNSYQDIVKNDAKLVHVYKYEQRFQIGEAMSCTVCQRTVEVIDLEFEKIRICSNCLFNYIRDLLLSRQSDLIENKYINFEYYCRPIPITKDVFIYDDDLSIMAGKTIAQYFYNLLNLVCSSCNKKENDNDMITKIPCECRLCFDCLVKKLKSNTNDLVYFNPYEKKNLQIDVIQCYCGIKLAYENILVCVHEKMIESFIQQAYVRLAQLTENHCLICETQVDKVPNDEINYKPVHVYDQEFKFEHIICRGCYDQKMSIVSSNNKLLTELGCIFCDKIHRIDKKMWKVQKQGSCCEGCLIF